MMRSGCRRAYAGHKKLSDREIGLIRRWIEQGAAWQRHWSLIPPKRPDVPAVKDASGRATPSTISSSTGWSAKGCGPRRKQTCDADPPGRRLDLTGLPPTPAEVDAFIADQSPDAYEKVVDRLLASPRYGERMAIRWLERRALRRHQRIPDRRRTRTCGAGAIG